MTSRLYLGVGEVIYNTARGAHNDVRPLAQVQSLVHHVDASHQHSCTQRNTCSKGFSLLCNLNGQLPGGGQHQGKQRLWLVEQILQPIIASLSCCPLCMIVSNTLLFLDAPSLYPCMASLTWLVFFLQKN